MIELKNISKNFGKNIVLKNLNIKFPSKGLYVIYGSNGIGKTTLLYILGLLDFSFKGKLIIDGLDAKQTNKSVLRKYRNENISYIFSKGNLISYLNVKENLYLGINDKENITRFISLPDKQDVKTLSGGEELLLSLSHEISLNKKIYLLDEVTAALDDENLNKVTSVLKELSKKSLVIMIAHDDRIKSLGINIDIFNYMDYHKCEKVERNEIR